MNFSSLIQRKFPKNYAFAFLSHQFLSLVMKHEFYHTWYLIPSLPYAEALNKYFYTLYINGKVLNDLLTAIPQAGMNTLYSKSCKIMNDQYVIKFSRVSKKSVFKTYFGKYAEFWHSHCIWNSNLIFRIILEMTTQFQPFPVDISNIHR